MNIVNVREWRLLHAQASRIALGLMLGIIVEPAAVFSQDYPTKAMRLIVPYPAGGPTDVIGRFVGQKLGEATGQQVVTDNRGGASSIVGTELAARAAPDGYTMLLVALAFAINPSVHDKLPYDSIRDFSPVSLLAQGYLTLVVHPSVPVKSVRELVVLAKARPGQLNYAFGGEGSSTDLASLLFQSMAGIQMTGVPYKGGGPGTVALLSGEVNVAFYPIAAAIPYIKTGKLRVLGLSSARRSGMFPDIPTVAEAGVPGYEVAVWYGVLLPGRTPQRIVAELNRHIVRIVQSGEVKDMFTAQGLEPTSNSPDEYSSYIAREITKWSRVIKDANARK